MNIGWPQYEPVTQRIMIPDEEIFVEIKRYWSWKMPDSDGWSTARSVGFVCPVCLKVWAMLSFPEVEPRFQASRCQQHRKLEKSVEACRVDGSIIEDIGYAGWGLIDYALLYALPADLLRREFDLHLQYAEKGATLGAANTGIDGG